MSNIPRREFLAAAAFPALAANRLSPNDKVRIALVGLRGRGRDLINGFRELAKENVEIAALCDVDENTLGERAAGLEQASGKRVPTLTDFRRLLDDKSIHAIGFATPNHWHAPAAIWSCQAGKDVYLEKPGSHTYWEGRKIMEAAAKHNRIVQHGTQNRSSPNIVQAVQKIKAGVIGRVYLARGIAYKIRGAHPKMTAQPVPKGLNWDLWQGPAPEKPFSMARYGRGVWHQLWDYGNGEIGNQGVHELDIMRWALDLDAHPSKIASMGGKYIHKDEQDAPHVISTMFEWAGRDVLFTFETRAGFTNTEAGMGAEYPFLDKRNVVGVIFIGTEGFMIIPDYSSYYTFLGPKREKGPSATGSNDITNGPHLANFVKAVRSGNPADLAAPPVELHRSCALNHFANIAWRTGRMLHFDSQTERFTGDEEASKLLSKSYRMPYGIA